MLILHYSLHKTSNSAITQHHPHGTVGHWETTLKHIYLNQCCYCIQRILSKSKHCQSYRSDRYKYNNRKVVIKITVLKPLWLFFASSWPVVQDVSNVLVFLSNCLLIGFRGCSGERVGVDGAVGAVCLAELVGVGGGNFGELVWVGWFFDNRCGLVCLWASVGLVSARWSSFQLCAWSWSTKKQVLRRGVLPFFQQLLGPFPVLFWARLWLFPNLFL